MASYWKSKVLPKLKKAFGNDTAKKAAAAEACKSLDLTKEEISKQLDEKKAELEPKVIEVYEASSIEIQSLVKEPKEAGLKKHSVKVQKFLEELVKIDFPGTKEISEASTKFGPGLIPGPVIFVFEKVSTFVVTITEEKPREVEVEAPAAAAAEAPATEATATEEATTSVVVEEETKKEIAVEEETPKEPELPKEDDPKA